MMCKFQVDLWKVWNEWDIKVYQQLDTQISGFDLEELTI